MTLGLKQREIKALPHQRYNGLPKPEKRPENSRLLDAVTFGTQHDNKDLITTTTMAQGAEFCDDFTTRLNDAISILDGEDNMETLASNAGNGHSINPNPQTIPRNYESSSASDEVARIGSSTLINFKKTWHYANSRLPPFLPPVKIYTETWSILCRAAHAAESVYSRKEMNREESETYIDADWQHGTKAMAIRSTMLDDKNLIVLAIRGSKWNLADWAVNFRPSPTQPTGFIDDEGNACHAGFLSVARAMVKPVATNLRHLLEQDPSRTSCSLVFTGHSAGGAVASLLYAHMLALSVESALTNLFGCFRRVHCVTFGAPPVSLLPLQKPNGKRFASSVFMSFVNEGDPVVRAEKEYIAALARSIATLTPDVYPIPDRKLKGVKSRMKLLPNRTKPPKPLPQPPYFPVPDSRLSNAGRLVILRTKPGQSQEVEAVGVDESQLRGVLFGDPAMHVMALYKQRIDGLAVTAITGRSIG